MFQPHGPMRRKERQINERADVEAILAEGKVMHLALCLGNRPFLVPVFYAFDGGAIYFHSAKTGEKIEILKQNPNVCFSVSLHQGVIPSDNACDFEARHRTAIGTGVATFVEAKVEKIQALDRIVARFTAQHFNYPAESLKQTAVIRIAIDSLKGKMHRGDDEGISL